MSDSLDECSKLLGDYLLKGWTMLGCYCQKHTTVPLMRERKGNKCICVLCDDRYYVEEGDHLLMYMTKPNNAQEKQQEKKPEEAESDDIDFDGDSVLKEIEERRRKELSQPKPTAQPKEEIQEEEEVVEEEVPEKKECKKHECKDVHAVIEKKINQLLIKLDNTNNLNEIRQLSETIASLKTTLDLF